MASKEVKFHEEAAREYEAAFDWYLERSESIAIRFFADVEQAIETISEAPQRWLEGSHGTRRFRLRRFPFSVIYRELPEAIQILAVAHGRRKPGYWKVRL